MALIANMQEKSQKSFILRPGDCWTNSMLLRPWDFFIFHLAIGLKKCGDLEGFWSVRINDQWRIVFKWIDNDAYDVKITDYH